MNTLIIHHLDDTLQFKLSQQAKQNGRSVEAEVKVLLTRLFADKIPVEEGMATKIQRIVQHKVKLICRY